MFISTPGNVLAVDTESTGLIPWPILARDKYGMHPDRPFAISFCNAELDTYCISGEVNKKDRSIQWSKKNLRDIAQFQEMLLNPELTIVFYNAMHDVIMLEEAGLVIECQIADSYIKFHILRPDEINKQLKSVSKKYLGIDDEDQSELVNQVKARRANAKAMGYNIATKDTHSGTPYAADYWLADREVRDKYAVLDAVRTMLIDQLCNESYDEDAEQGGRMWEVYNREMRLFKVLHDMKRRGFRIFPEKIKELTKLYSEYMEEQKVRMGVLGYPELNTRSIPQLIKAFVDERGLSVKGYTDKGNPRVNGDQIMTWARGSSFGADVDDDGPDGDPLARAVLEYRSAQKNLKYIQNYDFFRRKMRGGHHAIHANFNQCGSITGRLSSASPNLQQVTHSTTARQLSRLRSRLRELFGPDPGTLWYMPDYKQVEVWVFAFSAGEPGMMETLRSGGDFHTWTATTLWGKRPNFEKHFKWWRQRAKQVLFLKMYGGGAARLAELLRDTWKVAKGFIDDFDEMFPDAKRFMDDLTKSTKREGRLTNVFGRPYPIDPNFAYKCVNYYVQGTCADILKNAMIFVDEMLRRNHPPVKLVSNLHDELFVGVPLDYDRKHRKRLMRDVVRNMQRDSYRVPNLDVPLPVEMKICKTNWTETEEIEL